MIYYKKGFIYIPSPQVSNCLFSSVLAIIIIFSLLACLLPKTLYFNLLPHHFFHFQFLIISSNISSRKIYIYNNIIRNLSQSNKINIFAKFGNLLKSEPLTLEVVPLRDLRYTDIWKHILFKPQLFPYQLMFCHI